MRTVASTSYRKIGTVNLSQATLIILNAALILSYENITKFDAKDIWNYFLCKYSTSYC